MPRPSRLNNLKFNGLRTALLRPFCQQRLGFWHGVGECAGGFEERFDFSLFRREEFGEIFPRGVEDRIPLVDEDGLGDLILIAAAAFQLMRGAFGIERADLGDGAGLRSAAVCGLLASADDPHVAPHRNAHVGRDRVQAHECILMPEECHGVDLHLENAVMIGRGELRTVLIDEAESLVNSANVELPLRRSLAAEEHSALSEGRHQVEDLVRDTIWVVVGYAGGYAGSYAAPHAVSNVACYAADRAAGQAAWMR